ncbi:APA family basic amino acid/polyamine antiporter [Pedobacter sp. UYEF25]
MKEIGNLKKSFGLRMAIIMVMSAIIGTGVFKKVAPMAEGLLSPGLVMLVWALAGVVILCGILSIGELGAMFPESGGAFYWLEKTYGKLVAFLYGWSCFTVIQTAAIASVAYVFSGALGTFFPLPHLSQHLESITIFGIIQPLDNIGAKIITSLMIMLLTFININSTKKGGNLSRVFTYTIVLSILLIVAFSLSSAVGSLKNLSTNSVTYPPSGFATNFGFLGILVIAMRNAFWGYEGFIALGFIGEELREPRKNMPRAMLGGILMITLIYLLANFAYLYVMPIDELIASLKADKNLIAAVVVVNKVFGTGGAYAVSAMILVSTFGCTNATILLSSRIYYAMGKDNMFFKDAGKAHPKHYTPHKSLIYQCIWACILVFTGSFDLLTDLVVIAGFLFYGLVVFGVIILRIKNKDTFRPYKTWGYPAVPLVFVAVCIVLMVVSFIQSPAKASVGMLLIFTGLPFYYYWKAKNKKIEKQKFFDG